MPRSSPSPNFRFYTRNRIAFFLTDLMNAVERNSQFAEWTDEEIQLWQDLVRHAEILCTKLESERSTTQTGTGGGNAKESDLCGNCYSAADCVC